MYSVRVITKGHGNTQAIMLIYGLFVTASLIWGFGIDYLVIYCASALLHLVLETGLALSGIRKGEVHVLGVKLPPVGDAALKACVEGPGFCVPAFFAASHLLDGQIALGLAVPLLIVGVGSVFMGLTERRDVKQLGPNEPPQLSRRAMTRPGAVMLLTLINTGCLTALFLMPDPYRLHAFTYVISYALLALFYYLFNYNFGVRMIQLYDADKREYTTPGPLFQAAALTYDCAYEMALLISPAYWVTFYLGYFTYELMG